MLHPYTCKIYYIFGTLAIIGLGLVLNISLCFTIALTMYSVLFVERSCCNTAKGFSRVTDFPYKMWWPIINIGVPFP